MCCCVADAITTEHKFLKRHNEKFERLSTSVGQVRESLETLRRAFRPRPTSMIVRSFPRATKSKRKPATSSSKTDLFPGTVRHYGGRSSSSRGRREDLEQEQGTKSASTRSTTLGLPCVRY
jgi:hypothetical protein